MVELSRNCSAICTTSHGSRVECIGGKRGKKTLVSCDRGALNFSSSGRRTRGNLCVVDGSLMVAMAVECGSCGDWLRMPVRFRVVEAKRRGSLMTCTSSNSALVCEEEEVAMPVPGREDLIAVSNHEVKDEESRLCPFSETKLHFLEERNEEMLSKRILSLSRSNKVRSALELFTSMEMSGLQPDKHATNSLLACLVRNGSVDGALRVFEVMRKKDMSTGHTFSLILKAVAEAQGCDSALELFVDMEAEGRAKKSFDVVVYNTMISVCGRAKNWVETERMWRRLKENACCGTMVTYRLLVSTFVQCGQADLALGAYHEMIQNGLQPDEDIMKAIVAACTKDGKWALGLNVFRQMLGNDIKPNVIAYNAMINCLGKAGEADLAFRVYDLMKSSGHSPDTYTWNALLSALYRCGRYADTLRLFESIEREKSSELNVHLYNTALMSCQRLRLWDHSLQLLWQMEVTGVSVSTASYNLVIRACESAKQPKVALQVFQHMIHRKYVPDTFTYLSLIRACVWGSLWNEVEEILERVGPNASVYNALIHGFCLRGKITLAKKLYVRMCSSGLKPDGKTRALMLQHLPIDSVRHHLRYPFHPTINSYPPGSSSAKLKSHDSR